MVSAGTNTQQRRHKESTVSIPASSYGRTRRAYVSDTTTLTSPVSRVTSTTLALQGLGVPAPRLLVGVLHEVLLLSGVLGACPPLVNATGPLLLLPRFSLDDGVVASRLVRRATRYAFSSFASRVSSSKLPVVGESTAGSVPPPQGPDSSVEARCLANRSRSGARPRLTLCLKGSHPVDPPTLRWLARASTINPACGPLVRDRGDRACDPTWSLSDVFCGRIFFKPRCRRGSRNRLLFLRS